MLSRSVFNQHKDEFYKFYKDSFNFLDIKPNVTHRYLKSLEDQGKLNAIVTQNIDGLHEKAVNKNIYLLHGTIYKNHCMMRDKEYDAHYVFNLKILYLDVVLYEERSDEDIVNGAIDTIRNPDMLSIGDTSLAVYPAASFIKYFRGKYLVIINKDVTAYDRNANLVINDKLGNKFGKLK